MMVRFSCFSTPVNKSKKVVQQSVGKLLADCQSVTEDQSIKLVTGSIETNPMAGSNSSCNTVDLNISPCFQKECWQSDDLDAKLSEASEVIIRTVQIKKSHSLGNMMEKESDFYGDDIMGGVDIDHGFSREYLNDWNTKEVRDSFGDTISSEFNHHENDGKSYHNKQKKNDLIKSRDLLTDSIHNDSVYSVENLKQSDHDQHAEIAEQSADHFAISRCSSKKLPTLSRSCSVINLKVNVSESTEDTISHRLTYHRSHSFSDLNNFRGQGAEFQNHGRYFDSGINNEKTIIVSPSYLKPNSDGDEKAPCYFRAKEEGLSLVRSEMVHDHDSDDDSRKLEAKDAEIKQGCRQETSHYNWEGLTPEEFSMKRVEHWISQIDICADFIVEESGEGSANVCKEVPKISVDSRKPDARSLQAIEVPHNRISSLTSTSSSTQMANLGLVTVPVLSPFVSLRVVNLSGNVIARVTPGSLPKGLHMLNLSKNNISTIEGLRDLSHLRVLDLSYNRITKIGHGLSSCTSLKELYLVGNKISEVEGLHRLVKLNIIDLRFNKISTVKGLGQLAANYSSMQAINIEGNPAQINVGDEQLKKFLLGLLPNLVYYNKQAIRKGSKEVSGRSNFAAAAPHFDRGIRAEHKLPLKASMTSGLHKLTKSHGRQSHVEVTSMKLTKDRHARTHLPHAATKPTNRHLDSGKKLLSEAMRRSQSTDALWSYVKS
ncbi:hypothetical protein IEQ34_016587 [Dendrobium chrysotoxum]|uniref:Uncharacterized protein n=1 Tax=Dendrobium chrysotoxum TaxID=161865 RepID=A0AAV7GG15_DENCH|nr:hypothetical protein IEQ34_016587 [Dendrobium chrysotoxum]